VRRFNRFYTKRIGVLREGLLESPFSLTEARVLYELAHRDEPTAKDLGAELGLDAGYLSRILRGFERHRLIGRRPSTADGRQSLVSLTAKGEKAFALLDRRSREEVGALIGALPAPEQKRLVAAMDAVQGLLGAKVESKAPFLLRPPQPGDLGWVVSRHGALYAQEYGYDEEFEALVARIVADFAEGHDQNVGSVFLVRKSKTVAKLRLLLVEPKARGLGIGARLVGECVRFARQTGYRKLTLWTQSELHAARRLYEEAGFRRVHKERHHSFGHDLVAETWELGL